MKTSERYEPGDCCYALFKDGKVRFCEIKKVMIENKRIIYQVQDTIDWRFCVIDSNMCFDSETKAKKAKKKK